ncbi:hypothetical protein GAY33_05200 [Azospirillum brasilense]|uniref:hypothetical protein n=1 Tax=Azospirillum argentinense TaxID=2970906 RepID=UPI00190CED6A|nr:hypothetical protein [Azospirillum argentinense]MBK3798633.1 hypothetical protein [Azospirillum argentinense]
MASDDIATVQSQLASVRSAIALVESGAQSVAADQERVELPDLETLYRRETTLLNRLATLQGGAITVSYLRR